MFIHGFFLKKSMEFPERNRSGTPVYLIWYLRGLYLFFLDVISYSSSVVLLLEWLSDAIYKNKQISIKEIQICGAFQILKLYCRSHLKYFAWPPFPPNSQMLNQFLSELCLRTGSIHPPPPPSLAGWQQPPCDVNSHLMLQHVDLTVCHHNFNNMVLKTFLPVNKYLNLKWSQQLRGTEWKGNYPRSPPGDDRKRAAIWKLLGWAWLITATPSNAAAARLCTTFWTAYFWCSTTARNNSKNVPSFFLNCSQSDHKLQHNNIASHRISSKSCHRQHYEAVSVDFGFLLVSCSPAVMSHKIWNLAQN